MWTLEIVVYLCIFTNYLLGPGKAEFVTTDRKSSELNLLAYFYFLLQEK